MGDTLPDSYNPEIPGRRRKRDMVLPLLVLVSIGLSGYTLTANAQFRGMFPGQVLFTIQFAYQFSNTGGNAVLVPGSQANYELQILSLASNPTTLRLSFNDSGSAACLWQNANVFGVCGPRADKPLAMFIS